MERTQSNISLEDSVPLIDLERIPVAIPLRGDLAREAVEYVNEQKAILGNHLALEGHFTYNPSTQQINGSTPYHGILLNEFLSIQGSGLRTLTYQEAKSLDAQGKLSNGVYRDLGFIVYSPEGNNQWLASMLDEQIKLRGLEYPVVLYQFALDLKKDKGKQGVSLEISDRDDGIVSGSEAQKIVNSLDYRGNSGVRRLIRSGGGRWGGSWYGLGGSDDGGRVDWIRGEAACVDFDEKTKLLIEKSYNEQARNSLNELEAKRDKALRVIEDR